MKRMISAIIYVTVAALPFSVCLAQNVINKPILESPRSKPKAKAKRNNTSIVPKIKYEDIATLKQGETYSKVYEYGSNGLAVVTVERPYGTKYGMIDKSGNIVVPLMYDGLGKNSYVVGKEYVWVEHQTLRKVSKKGNNGAWKSGYIDANGKIVIPLVYDSSSEDDEVVMETDKLIRVKKEGKWGCLKPDGSELVSCVYDEMDKFKYGNPAFVKKDGKYGYLDALGNLFIPCRYTTAESFSSNRAPVSINGRYGYIDWLGSEVIPLEYEYAMPFYGGLGGVVKNGKLGFIDRYGKVIIPFEYDISTKGYSRRGASYFKYGVVAIVENNGKWGVINKKNEQVQPFVYEYRGALTSYGAAVLGNSYMDWGGNIYPKWTEEIKRTEEVLSEKGIAEGQYRLGLKARDSKDYQTAKKWFSQAARQGHAGALCNLGWLSENGLGQNKDYEEAAIWYEKAIMEDDGNAMNHLGSLYYYGRLHAGKDLKRAFNLYNQAADHHQSRALYMLGWMYEHGQSTVKDMDKAYRYYLKSSQQGYEPATKRLLELKKQ